MSVSKSARLAYLMNSQTRVKVTNPAFPERPWVGTIIGLTENPSLILDQEGSFRVTLPQAFAVEPASEAPSRPVETTGADSGTTSYTGVIRDADEAERLRGLLAQEARVNLGLLDDIDTDAATVDGMHRALERLNATILERDAMIATDDIELQAKDAMIAERDASIARLTIRLAKDDRDAMIERLTDNAPSQIGEPCPDSCGGQSWTSVGTSRGHRWRCDTCNRIISRYITDAIQAADDRRSL